MITKKRTLLQLTPFKKVSTVKGGQLKIIRDKNIK